VPVVSQPPAAVPKGRGSGDRDGTGVAISFPWLADLLHERLPRRVELMPLKVKDRPYNSDALRELMYETGGWAQGWDDVLWYLRTVAPHDHTLYQREHVQALVFDIEHLRRTAAR
jgi:hypothetical protein